MLATLMFIIDEARGEVLLIRKKRGLGAGKINGPGGKIDPGETSEQCAIRETQEELGVTALAPVKHGELWFQFVDGLSLHVDVFIATAHEGTAIETDEAIPLWTPLKALPLDEMWAALLEGRDAITDLPEGRWEEFLSEPRIAERVAKAGNVANELEVKSGSN